MSIPRIAWRAHEASRLLPYLGRGGLDLAENPRHPPPRLRVGVHYLDEFRHEPRRWPPVSIEVEQQARAVVLIGNEVPPQDTTTVRQHLRERCPDLVVGQLV